MLLLLMEITATDQTTVRQMYVHGFRAVVPPAEIESWAGSESSWDSAFRPSQVLQQNAACGYCLGKVCLERYKTWHNFNSSRMQVTSSLAWCRASSTHGLPFDKIASNMVLRPTSMCKPSVCCPAVTLRRCLCTQAGSDSDAACMTASPQESPLQHQS